MIINDGDLFRPGSGPPEDNTPLIVDANGMKTRQIAVKNFQTVARRNVKIEEGASLVQLNQLPQSDPRYCYKAEALLCSE